MATSTPGPPPAYTAYHSLRAKKNLHVYMHKGGSHLTRILSFPESERQEIINLIDKWLKE